MASRLERASTRAKQVERFVVAPYGDSRAAHYRCADNTNNEVEINEAIEAANALTDGGIIELLDGEFFLSSRVIPLSNVWLRGQGMFSTKLSATSSMNKAILDNKEIYDRDNPWMNGIISDMELDGTLMPNSSELKGLNADNLNNCKIMRVYCHDTTATGLGADDFYGSTISECIVTHCGYTNKRTVTAASWAASTFSFTTSSAHGYSVGDTIVITDMLPLRYNGKYKVSSIVNTTNFTIDGSNNSGNLILGTDPGAATTFGYTSDSLIGHNGIGIASGDNYSEAMVITNNVCIGNQNNNFLIEADSSNTGDVTTYNFTNNVSIRAGVNGYLNTGSVNVQFSNCYDYGSPSGIQTGTVGQNKTITAASWLASVVTFTTSSAHGYSVGGTVTVTGMTPSGYNGVYTVVGTPTTTTYTVALASNPGVATVFGTSSRVAHPTNNTIISGCTLDFNILYGIRYLALSDAYEITGTTVKNSFNYGIFLGSSRGNITGGAVHDNGRDGIIIQVGSGAYNPINRINIIGTQVYNNGKYIASSDGIDITPVSTAGVTDVNITGVQAYDNQATKTQRYGIIARSGGTISNLSISGGNLSGNLTGALLLQNTGDNISVNNVVGVNPQAKSELGNVSGSTSFDASLANYFTATLTGNITAVMPASAVIGTVMTWVLTQDATGGRTLTLPANAKPSATGLGLVISTAASVVDTITWIYDGTNWREASRDLATTKFTSREGISSVSPAASNVTALTITQQDTTNAPDGYAQTNTTTGTGMRVTQSGVLAANNYAAFIDSNAVQVNAPLMRIRQQNASSTKGNLQLDNVGSGQTLDLKDATGSVFTVASNGATVINERGLDADTRVEGDTDANLLFIDASTDSIGVGTATPGAKFESKVTGASSLVAIQAIMDSSVASQSAFIAKNLTNFAHAGDLVKFQLVNGSDSGNVLVITNAGTGLSLKYDGRGAAQVGTSSSYAKIGGTLFSYTTDAGSSTTIETDLYSDSVPANALSTNKDKLEARYAGEFVSSGTATRQLRCYFGGTAIFDSGALSISLSADWDMEVLIIRVSSSVVRYTVKINTTGAAASVYANVGELTGLTLSNANTLKITGQAAGVGAATNDIVARLGTVEFKPAP